MQFTLRGGWITEITCSCDLSNPSHKASSYAQVINQSMSNETTGSYSQYRWQVREAQWKIIMAAPQQVNIAAKASGTSELYSMFH